MSHKTLSVLVIEDEKVLQDVYSLILSSNGYKVYTADNGKEGLNQLKLQLPDLVILDIFMPVMDGRELLQNYDKASYPNTTIVVFSNTSDTKIRQEVLRNGADKFVQKSSLAPLDLLNLVNGYLRP